VQTSVVSVENVTGSPELVLALTVNGALPNVLSPSGSKVIVWPSPAMVNCADPVSDVCATSPG
jgi:hypothetical protein